MTTRIKQFPYQSPNISVSRDRENSRWIPGSFCRAPLPSSTDRTEAPAPFHKSHPLCLQAFPTSILLNEDSYNACRDTADRHFQLLTALFILAQHNPIRKVELNSVQRCSDQTHKFAHMWTASVEHIALCDTGWIHSAGLHPMKTPSVGAELHLHEWKAVGWLSTSLLGFLVFCQSKTAPPTPALLFSTTDFYYRIIWLLNPTCAPQIHNNSSWKEIERMRKQKIKSAKMVSERNFLLNNVSSCKYTQNTNKKVLMRINWVVLVVKCMIKKR